MSLTIEKIRLINFKRFQDYTLEPKPRINVLVGDNEVGKSSILEAIDLVASGSIKKVESMGLDRLLNINAVHSFLQAERTFENLPKLIVELYVSGCNDHTMNGNNNSEHRVCDGIRLVCEANPDYRTEITHSLQAQDDYFPYDFYSIRFSTFADEGYTGYKKKLRSVFIDSSSMNTEHATTDFVRRMYIQYTEADVKERAMHKSMYRQMKTQFCAENMQTINERIPAAKNYSFGLRNGSSQAFENDLMIYEDQISLESKGTGKQVFIKTDFALEHAGADVDVILIEEPENHLSHVNLREMLQRVANTQNGQIFVTTHNSLISTRLELKNLFILHAEGENRPTTLDDLSDDTAQYFMKTPPAGIIEYALSNKIILVEGPSEYMLFERFYETTAHCKPENDGVHIMVIRGLSFIRYLDIARLTGAKVAVVTDNDGDIQTNITNKYSAFANIPNMKVCYCQDEGLRTFEIVLYHENSSLCDRLFGNDAENHMLKNKTESAYALLDQGETINVPAYIREAIEWIRS